jgi:hypothetical protein
MKSISELLAAIMRRVRRSSDSAKPAPNGVLEHPHLPDDMIPAPTPKRARSSAPKVVAASSPTAQIEERPVRGQRPPAHLLEAASRQEEQRLADKRTSAPANKRKEPEPQAAEQPNADPAPVAPSEVLVQRCPGKALHLLVRDLDKEYVHISWHNDTDPQMGWRIPAAHVTSAVRRVFLSSAFSGCSFAICKSLFDELPKESQDMIETAVKSGIVHRADGKRWKYEGTVIVLGDDNETHSALASFDCWTESPRSRKERWESVMKEAPLSA